MRRRRLGLIPLLAIGGGILLAAVIASRLLSLNAISELREDNDRIVVASERIVLASKLESRVIDLQSGARGFLITGDPVFLAPRKAALRRIPRLQKELLAIVPPEDQRDRTTLRRLNRLIDRYANGYQVPLLALARSDLDAARTAVRNREGIRQMAEMRDLLSRFIRSQTEQQAQRRAAANSFASREDAVGIARLIVVPLLVLLVLLGAARGVVGPVRRLADSARRIGEGGLDTRVSESGAGELRDLGRDFNAMADSIQRSHEQLDRAAGFRQRVLETANDTYMATDENGHIVEWTQSAERMFGYSREEALGRPVEELTMPEELRPLFHEGREELLSAGSRDEPMRFEAIAMDRDGRRFYAEVSAAAILAPGGWVLSAFLRDIDERVQRSRSRRAAEAVSRVLAASGGDEDVLARIVGALAEALELRGGSLWDWDENTRSLRCVHIWDAREGGLEVASAAARELTLDSAERPAHDVGLRAVERNEVLWAPIDPERLDDEAIRALYSAGVRSSIALPIMAHDLPLGVLQLAIDSDTRPAEELLEGLRGIADLIAQVIGRRRAEVESERLKEEFFALVSHELRTPLTSIVGYLDIVRGGEAGELSEQQARFLDVIDRNAQRLVRLVGDLLFVAQVEAGTLSLERGEVDLAAVAGESVEAARPRAMARGVSLALEAEPVELHGADADRLGQLIDNLISNAVKFTPSEGRVEVRVGQRDSTALVEVADTGVGIPVAEQERLFERFYRSPQASAEAVPGIGLGLSICEAIVDGHGGTISIDSEVGTGTTFKVALPLDAQAPGEDGEPADG
jgi:PAS domain S-box-containing protein